VASAAAVVAAALSKARESSAAQNPFAPSDQVPPPQGTPLYLDTNNLASKTTGLQLSHPSQVPALRVETEAAGIQIIGQEWADAAPPVLKMPCDQSPSPGMLVVGRSSVFVGENNDPLPTKPTDVSQSLAVAAGTQASAVGMHIGDAGVGLIGIQLPEFDPTTVSDAMGVTVTAVVDMSTGVLGVAATGAGLRGRAMLPGGIGGIFEAPPGEDEVGAKVKGDLVVQGGDVRAEGANFGGDVNVDGKFTINGEELEFPCPPILGSGTFAAKSSSAGIMNDDLTPGSFVQVMFTAAPSPKGLAVSHIATFQGGCNIYLTGRTSSDLPFNWIAFCG
jgi:hypothetical protein